MRFYAISTVEDLYRWWRPLSYNDLPILNQTDELDIIHLACLSKWLSKRATPLKVMKGP